MRCNKEISNKEQSGMHRRHGQSTLEWVVGAAIILSTLVGGIMVWNQGLASKMGQMVSRLLAQ